MKELKKILKGLSAGFTWTYDGTGYSSKTSAVIAGYHHPDSITWRWALLWRRGKWSELSCRLHKNDYGFFKLYLSILGVYEFAWQPHVFRDKR